MNEDMMLSVDEEFRIVTVQADNYRVLTSTLVWTERSVSAAV